MAAVLPRILILAAIAAFTHLQPAAAEPIPAPPDVLKDYDGKGYIQLDLPADKPSGADIRLWFPFRQAYIRPDRLLMDFDMQGVRQRTLIQGATERTYGAGLPYVIQRTYKNLAAASQNPMTAAQLSMATWAKLVRELDTGKLLPAEDLDALRESHKARLEALKKERALLADRKTVEASARASTLALESARLNDDLRQLEIRRRYPCQVVEFENKHLMQHLFTRGLSGDSAQAVLGQGKTRVWVTKGQGLPIKIETMANDGRVAIYLSFVELKVNDGLHPAEVLLGAPPGALTLSVSADLRDKNWELKMDQELSEKVALVEERRSQQFKQRPPVLGNGKGKR